MNNDSLGVSLARVEEKVESILEKVECLPKLSETQARHDERIGNLERAGKWALGVVAGVLSGLILSIFAFIARLAHFAGKGGTP